MSGESPKKTGRGYARDLEAGQFQPTIDSWDLHLRAERKSAKTVRTYLEAAQWLASAGTEQGSWWPDFAAWLGERCGPVAAAPQHLGGDGLRPLTEAPGTYVFEK